MEGQELWMLECLVAGPWLAPEDVPLEQPPLGLAGTREPLLCQLRLSEKVEPSEFLEQEPGGERKGEEREEELCFLALCRCRVASAEAAGPPVGRWFHNPRVERLRDMHCVHLPNM